MTCTSLGGEAGSVGKAEQRFHTPGVESRRQFTALLSSVYNACPLRLGVCLSDAQQVSAEWEESLSGGSITVVARAVGRGSNESLPVLIISLIACVVPTDDGTVRATGTWSRLLAQA